MSDAGRNATIRDKSSFSQHVYFLTQQNIFQTDAFEERKPLIQFNFVFHRRPGIRLSFEYTTTLLSGKAGEKRTGTGLMFEKMLCRILAKNRGRDT